MLASDAAARPVMFSGLARSRRIRDAAIIAVWLSIVGGFVAHVATPPTSQHAHEHGALAASAQTEAGVRVQ